MQELPASGLFPDAQPPAHHNGNDGAGTGAERRPVLMFFAAGGKARLFEFANGAAF
jgi:hypothetical protein